MKRIKMFSFILAIILLFTVLFSSMYIIEHTHHNCLGEDCPICLELEMAAHVVSSFKTLIPLILIFIAVIGIPDVLPENRIGIYRSNLTLISLKVELDD